LKKIFNNNKLVFKNHIQVSLRSI